MANVKVHMHIYMSVSSLVMLVHFNSFIDILERQCIYEPR